MDLELEELLLSVGAGFGSEDLAFGTEEVSDKLSVFGADPSVVQSTGLTLRGFFLGSVVGAGAVALGLPFLGVAAVGTILTLTIWPLGSSSK